MAIASYQSPSLSSSESDTRVFTTGSFLETLRTSFDPSSEDKSVLGPRVAELGIEDGVTTKKKPSFTTWERAMKGLLAYMTQGVAGEVLTV